MKEIREEREAINRSINRCFRQLGKQVYEDLMNEQKKDYQKVVKKINQKIEALNALAYKLDVEIIDEKTIYEPEQNQEGLYLYNFCSVCHAGNNPKSTHCIRCHAPLN